MCLTRDTAQVARTTGRVAAGLGQPPTHRGTTGQPQSRRGEKTRCAPGRAGRVGGAAFAKVALGGVGDRS